MFNGKKIGAILLMAGSGCRFEHDTPKQFHLLGEKPVYIHPLHKLLAVGFFDEIILVTHPNWFHLDVVGAKLIQGGASRQASSYLGLKAFKHPPDIVLIHDAVRPFVSERILKRNVIEAIDCGAVDTCLRTADTLVISKNGKEISSIPNRAEYFRGQTPQTFRYDWVLQAHEDALAAGIENASDDCSLLLRSGKTIRIVEGEEINFKITSPFDLFLAEQMKPLEKC